MNKKNIVTRENIAKVADFLEEACDYFKNDGEGCYGFPLSEDLALYVGWSYGYDMADTDIIKSAGGREERNDLTCGWAVNAGIKVRNDYDCAEYDYLNAPWFADDGEVADTAISVRPNMTRRDYKREARYFLQEFVAMTNAIKSGKLLTD